MKCECVKEKLEPAITKATRVTAKNVTLPVLQCVLLEAAENQLIIRATNLDIGVEFRVPVKVSEPGVIALPGDVLARYLAQLPDETITMETGEHGVTVTTQSSTTTVNTVDHEDFPTLPQVTESRTFRAPAKHLANGLRSVVYAAATSSMKPELASVYCGVSEDQSKLVFTATDSFRLAEKRLEVGGLPQFDYILIPARNVTEMIRLCDEVEQDIEVRIDEGQLAFEFGDTYITTRLIDGTFPDYTQIIPSSYTSEATVLKRDLLSALKLTTIFADKFHRVTFAVDPAHKHLTLTTRNTELGESVNELDGALSGDALSITFNHKYVLDGFQSITADSVVLQFAGEGKPLVIQGVSDQSFTYLVSPMNQ